MQRRDEGFCVAYEATIRAITDIAKFGVGF